MFVGLKEGRRIRRECKEEREESGGGLEGGSG